MSDADGGTQVKVRDGAAVWREVDGETVLLDLASSTYLGINPAGTVLWPAMVEGAPLGQLADLLQERYGLPRDQAEVDARNFVDTCRQRGLLQD